MKNLFVLLLLLAGLSAKAQTETIPEEEPESPLVAIWVPVDTNMVFSFGDNLYHFIQLDIYSGTDKEGGKAVWCEEIIDGASNFCNEFYWELKNDQFMVEVSFSTIGIEEGTKFSFKYSYDKTKDILTFYANGKKYNYKRAAKKQ